MRYHDEDTAPPARRTPEGYLTPTAIQNALGALELKEKYYIPAELFCRTTRPYISRAGKLLRRTFAVRKTPTGYNVWRIA